MFSLTRKTDYALVALSELAKGGAYPVSARDLAGRLNVSVRVLTNILNRLTHHELVSSTRGVNGGYMLAKHPTEITLELLIEAIEGPVYLARCCPTDAAADDRECLLQDSCSIKEPMRRLDDRMKEFLSRVTLCDLASTAVPLTISTASLSHGQSD